jgi:secreted PhoX family phosphatase
LFGALITWTVTQQRRQTDETCDSRHDDARHPKVERRQFLQTALGAAATVPALQALRLLDINGRVHAAPGKGGYGPLVPTPDLRDGVMRIALPEEFQYRSFSPAGAWMSDGHRVPLAHDGMAVFNMPDGKYRLVRNHEDRNAPLMGSTAVEGNAYDPLGGGGMTTLVVNPFTRELERDFISLNGTIVNCAGGMTPWISWITAEETNAGVSSGWSRQHGYCFDVPVSADSSVPAFALTDMGRFSHEANAVDPATWIVYETEDNGSNSGFYRYLAHTPGALSDGGRLQMLAIDGAFNYDTRTGETVGAALPVKWVDIANPNPPGTSSTAVFDQGYRLGGARFARLEGCWWGNGAV